MGASCGRAQHTQLRNACVQTQVPPNTSKSCSSQTEDRVSSAAAQSSAVRTVRIMRMQRLASQSQSQPVLPSAPPLYEVHEAKRAEAANENVVLPDDVAAHSAD